MLVEVMLLFLVFCAWQMKRFGNKKKIEPPNYPGYIPIIGHAMLFFENSDSIRLWRLITSVIKETYKNDGAVSVSVCGHQIYMLTDPSDCLTVSNSCLSKDALYDFSKVWIEDALLIAPATVWKRKRKLLNRTFSQQILDGYIDVFNSQSRRLVEELAAEVNAGPFDHTFVLKKIGLETFCLTAMGVNEGKEVVSNIYEEYMRGVNDLLNVFSERFQKFWLHNNLIFSVSSLRRKHDDLVNNLNRITNQIIQKRKEELLESGLDPSTRYKSFLDQLLELTLDGTYTDRDVQNEINAMIVAGYDTSAGTNMFILTLLGSHPDVQEKVYKELQEVFDNSDRDLDKSDYSKLIYLEAVIKESLRLYPVAPIVARYLDKDVKLKNYILLEGATCAFGLYGLGRHPMWGPDADKFCPERWLDASKLPDNPHAFAGFSVGSRTCIGKVFAMMSMKTTLSHVLRRYKVTGDCSNLVLKVETLLRAVDGHQIAIEPRQKTLLNNNVY